MSDERNDDCQYWSNEAWESQLQERNACPPMPQPISKTVFQASVVPNDLPEGSLGLPELIFEDKISDREIYELLKKGAKVVEKDNDGI